MQLRHLTTAVLSLALLTASVLPAKAYTEGAAQAEPTGFFSQNCYRNTFSGGYETRYISHPDYTLVHSGACTKCEGKNVLDCFEPGDDPAVNVRPSEADSNNSSFYQQGNMTPQTETTPWAY